MQWPGLASSPNGSSRQEVRMRSNHRHTRPTDREHAAVSGSALRFRAVAATIGAVALVVAGAAWFSATGPPNRATVTQFVGGSVVLDDAVAPIALDLATGTPSVRFENIGQWVGNTAPGHVDALALSDATLLVNDQNGTFNYLGTNNLIVRPEGDGIALPTPSFPVLAATAVARSSTAYIVQAGADRAAISLLDAGTLVTAREQPAPGGGSASPVQLGGAADVPTPVATGPGSLAVVGGDLWTVTGVGPRTSVRAFGPNPLLGHPLVSLGTWRTASLSALSVGVPTPGTGHVVAVATPAAIRLFSLVRGRVVGAGRLVRLNGLPTATAIVPVRDVPGHVDFVYEHDGGASLVAVSLDGALGGGPGGAPGGAAGGTSGGPHASVIPLALPSGAHLVDPVDNNGTVYAIGADGTSTPPLVTVDPTTGSVSLLPDIPRYPVEPGEAPRFDDDPEVLSVGPRVVFNNPQSRLGVVVFTNRSRPPTVFAKSSGVAIDPAAPPGAAPPGAVAVTDHASPVRHHDPAQPVPVATTAQPLDLKIQCLNTTQKPLVPQITAATPSAHSVVVDWTYPPLTNNECEPTSYVVSATSEVGGVQPAPQGAVVGGGGTMTDVYTGLRSNTSYQFVVTAYIGSPANATSSPPFAVTTSAQGPNAPLQVTASADKPGGWTVHWTSCPASSCTDNDPVQTWEITSAYCAGTGYAGSAPALSVLSDGATSQSAFVPFADPSDAGQAFGFTVYGIGTDGLQGDPLTAAGCPIGWSAPHAALIAAPTTTATLTPAGTVDASVSITPVRGVTGPEAFGSATPLFSYTLLLNGSVVAGPTAPTGTPAYTFTGLTPGTGNRYAVSVSVAPSEDPTDVVDLASPVVPVTVPWPTGAAIASLVGTVDTTAPGSPGPDSGSVDVTLTGLYPPSGAAGGPLIVASPTITCGGTQVPDLPTDIPVSRTPTGTGGTLSVPMDDLVNEGGPDCELSLSLTDTSGYYGSTDTLPAARFSIGTPLPASPAPFTAQSTTGTSLDGVPLGDAAIQVADTGTDGRGQGVVEVSIAEAGYPPSCSSIPTTPPGSAPGGDEPSGFTVDADVQPCLDALAQMPSPPDDASFVVTVSWTYLGAVQVYTLPAVTFPVPAPPGGTESCTAPQITAISPTSGSGSGGTVVTLTGCDLSGTTKVTFGSTPGTSLVVGRSGSSLKVTSPAGSGSVPVTVTLASPTGSGTLTITAPEPFTYVASGP